MSSTFTITSVANMNLQNWTVRPDIDNDKPNLEISNIVPQEQAELLSQEPSMNRMTTLSQSEGRTGFTVCRIRGKSKVCR